MDEITKKPLAAITIKDESLELVAGYLLLVILLTKRGGRRQKNSYVAAPISVFFDRAGTPLLQIQYWVTMRPAAAENFLSWQKQWKICQPK
jgi:hypothetical protein